MTWNNGTTTKNIDVEVFEHKKRFNFCKKKTKKNV